MNHSDWILLLTAGIAAWYAWETRSIRKQGQQANALLNDQLRLIQEAQQREAHRTNSALAPVLRPHGSDGGGKEFRFKFKNLGGLVTNASIQVDNDIQSRLYPETIAPNDEGFIKIETKESSLPISGYCLSLIHI